MPSLRKSEKRGQVFICWTEGCTQKQPLKKSKSGNRIEQVTTDLRSSGGTLVVVSRVQSAFPNSLDALSDDLFFLEEVPFNSIASGGGVEKYLELLSLFHGVPWGLARVAAEGEENSWGPGELLIDVVPVPVLGITRVAGISQVSSLKHLYSVQGAF